MPLFLATLYLLSPLLKISVEVEGQGKSGEPHKLGCSEVETPSLIPKKVAKRSLPPAPCCLTEQPSSQVVGGKWHLLEEGPRLISCSSPLPHQVPRDRA